MPRNTTAVEIDGNTYYVAKLTLGGRQRIQQSQQAMVFGNTKIAGDQIRSMISGGGGNMDALLAGVQIPVSELFGSGERQQALLIKECICTKDGQSVFATVEQVLDELDGDEADRMIRAIESLTPPLAPKAEAIEGMAGNCEATT